jgi:hypothetical protein
MPRAGHLHIEPSTGQRVMQGIETVGKTAVQVGGALNTAYQVGKGFAYAARYAAPLLGLL